MSNPILHIIRLYNKVSSRTWKLRHGLIELRDAYIDLVFPEGFPDELDDAIEALGGKIKDVFENVNMSLESL